MGLMKEFEMDVISEFAQRIGVSEQVIYNNEFLYGVACLYAERKLQKNLEKIRQALQETN